MCWCAWGSGFTPAWCAQFGASVGVCPGKRHLSLACRGRGGVPGEAVQGGGEKLGWGGGKWATTLGHQRPSHLLVLCVYEEIWAISVVVGSLLDLCSEV